MERKAIFITGGGSGIGRAVAIWFAARGWFVGIADISESGMAETEKLLPPGSCSTHKLDVRDREAWDEALAAFAKASGGRIDVLFNNAGIGTGGMLADLDKNEIDTLIAINVTGVVYGAQAAYPYLKAAAPGSSLVNTASAAGLYGSGGLALYSATKFAVRGLTEALDTEWGEDGIHVCSLMPSFIDTGILAGPANKKTNMTKRESVIRAGLEFTPVEVAAETVWNAVNGGKTLHNLVGKTAKSMAFAAKWMPGKLRQRSRMLMKTRTAME
ncbi:SDR family oxidoreductase [Novosphingobium sp. TH158]|uniref:SDR family oxidoreductase n=1 Tax=Novosphingobium sp. TH158 TaxID=2067455 RepID=UPI000C7A1DE3|nr:SDR family oxidoreductase [Novosphingobium sp. TH158]PLK26408.1 short-chain dehydrogenase [Novosphingobium sp. TH158]